MFACSMCIVRGVYKISSDYPCVIAYWVSVLDISCLYMCQHYHTFRGGDRNQGCIKKI